MSENKKVEKALSTATGGMLTREHLAGDVAFTIPEKPLKGHKKTKAKKKKKKPDQ